MKLYLLLLIFIIAPLLGISQSNQEVIKELGLLLYAFDQKPAAGQVVKPDHVLTGVSVSTMALDYKVFTQRVLSDDELKELYSVVFKAAPGKAFNKIKPSLIL